MEIDLLFRYVMLEKPPDDRKKRYWFYKNKQTYARFLRFYGNSLEGGIDRAKVITVKENGSGKKKGKDKTGKVVSEIASVTNTERITSKQTSMLTTVTITTTFTTNLWCLTPTSNRLNNLD